MTLPSNKIFASDCVSVPITVAMAVLSRQVVFLANWGGVMVVRIVVSLVGKAFSVV